MRDLQCDNNSRLVFNKFKMLSGYRSDNGLYFDVFWKLKHESLSNS